MLIFLVLPTLAIACGPGTGQLAQTATFTYEIVPPVMYTWAASLSNGQISEAYAAQVAKSDVQSAVNAVLTANSIPTTDLALTLNFFPPNTPLVTTCPATASETSQFFTQGGLVLYNCSNTNSAYSITQTVKVTAIQQIYESQWQTLNSQIQDNLNAKRGTLFLSSSYILA
ncbi:unnamed protein product [Caenorhabditis angaria]|uniref:Uncharacterized protein n=1 Tax=Caenorhabditis angaria TaxID=860376 RepID=A0A9P1IV63_9PELO|nr:unnamed protein product [Caenorhabditis angaria]